MERSEMIEAPSISFSPLYCHCERACKRGNLITHLGIIYSYITAPTARNDKRFLRDYPFSQSSKQQILTASRFHSSPLFLLYLSIKA